jgi:hypothetical protein
VALGLGEGSGVIAGRVVSVAEAFLFCGRLHIGELSNTKHEPLAVRLRYHLRKRGVRPMVTLLA